MTMLKGSDNGSFLCNGVFTTNPSECIFALFRLACFTRSSFESYLYGARQIVERDRHEKTPDGNLSCRFPSPSEVLVQIMTHFDPSLDSGIFSCQKKQRDPSGSLPCLSEPAMTT